MSTCRKTILCYQYDVSLEIKNWTRTVLWHHLSSAISPPIPIFQLDKSKLSLNEQVPRKGDMQHAALSCMTNFIHPVFAAKLGGVTSHALLSDIPCPPDQFWQAPRSSTYGTQLCVDNSKAVETHTKLWYQVGLCFHMVHVSRNCCNGPTGRAGSARLSILPKKSSQVYEQSAFSRTCRVVILGLQADLDLTYSHQGSFIHYQFLVLLPSFLPSRICLARAWT